MHKKRDNIWSSRIITIDPFGKGAVRGDEEWEKLFDLLPDRYWEGWRSRIIYHTLTLSSSGKTIHVGDWPWWIPKRVALRDVSRLVAECGLDADLRYEVVWTVMQDD